MDSLKETYSPKKILFRENEIEEIKQIQISFKRSNLAINKILFGGSGTGKTTIAKSLQEGNNDYCYISCADLKTSKRIFRRLSDVPFEECEKKFLKDPKIIIFDEINKITNIKEFFDDLNTFFRATNCPIILITNISDIIRQMPEDARKTLRFSRVIFRPYTLEEMQSILNQRVIELKAEGVECNLPENLVPYISALAYKDNNLRIAMDLLHRAIDSQKFSVNEVRDSFQSMQIEDRESWFLTLNETESLLLKKVIELMLEKSENEQMKNKIYYSELADRFIKDSHIQHRQRVSQIVLDFEKNEVLRSEMVWLGRAGGQDKILFFKYPEDLIYLGKKFFPEAFKDAVVINDKKQVSAQETLQ